MRLIGSDGEQKGIVPIEEALRLAREEQLDLVEVAAAAKPPVCRILNYGKYRYQKSKRDQIARKKQKGSQLKEIQMRPKTEQHDFDFKMRHVKRFLEGGHKIKVTVKFRGREMSHTDRGKSLLDKVAVELQEDARIEVPPKLEGRRYSMIIAPKPKNA